MRRIGLSLIILVLAAGVAGAQATSFMAVNDDVESLGLGGASIAIGATEGAADNNIAVAALYEGRGIAGANYTLWQPKGTGSGIVGVSGFSRVGKRLALGLSGRYFLEKPYEMYDSFGVAAGSFKPGEYRVGIGASYMIINGLAAGINLKLAGASLAPSASATVFAADVHLAYRTKGLLVGLGVSNLGTKADFGYGKYSIPASARGGASYSVAGVTLAGEVGWQFGGTAASGSAAGAAGGLFASVGAEYCILGWVDVRAGYHYGGAAVAMRSFASVGLGAEVFGVRLNAAYLFGGRDSYINGTFAVSLGYAF